MTPAVARLLDPVHTWRCGRTGSVMLLRCPPGVETEHARPGVPLLFLSELEVAPRERGRGYGGVLLKACTDWAQSAKTDLWLYVAPNGPLPRLSRTQLAELYGRHGFRRVAPGSPDIEMVWRYG